MPISIAPQLVCRLRKRVRVPPPAPEIDKLRQEVCRFSFTLLVLIWCAILAAGKRQIGIGRCVVMPATKGLEWTFDTVASTYEKLRPGYVKELYQTLFNYIPVNENSNVVEVGSGGGQATAPILTTGCRLTAVEYGEQFSELLKEKFKEFQKFSVITGKFEDTVFEDNAFDLVFSASAFHWVPEKIGYEKVFSMLKSGGAFARFANHPYRNKGNPALSQEIDEIYDRYYNITALGKKAFL